MTRHALLEDQSLNAEEKGSKTDLNEGEKSSSPWRISFGKESLTMSTYSAKTSSRSQTGSSGWARVGTMDSLWR